MKERLFKVLGSGREPCNGGSGKWPPVRVWRKVDGLLVPCENGLHLCLEQDLVYWLGPTIYEAECRGERMFEENQIVAQEARLLRRVRTWNEQTARLFACDCAKHVLPLFEHAYPGDTRPRACIKIGRRFAMGQATLKELAVAKSIAWDVSGEAAKFPTGAPAYGAAEAAAWTVSGIKTQDDPWAFPVWVIAGAAAGAAAQSSAWAAWGAWGAPDATYESADAARNKERAWQTERLMGYLYPRETR